MPPLVGAYARDEVLTVAELADRAAYLRKAYFAKLGLKSALAPRKPDAPPLGVGSLFVSGRLRLRSDCQSASRGARDPPFVEE
jgi:hypothetical protein